MCDGSHPEWTDSFRDGPVKSDSSAFAFDGALNCPTISLINVHYFSISAVLLPGEGLHDLCVTCKAFFLLDRVVDASTYKATEHRFWKNFSVTGLTADDRHSAEEQRPYIRLSGIILTALGGKRDIRLQRLWSSECCAQL